ncbi:MAG TPA: hypothetical protein VF062_27320 [Candidatus Limnocylindrales bacterium]
MSLHLPENHPLRPVYRFLSFLTGAIAVDLGIVGVVKTWGDPLTGPSEATALGVNTNPLFSYLSLAAGAIVMLATLIGRNVDRIVYLWIGLGWLVLGTLMMLLMGKHATNYFNATMVSCVVAYVMGSVLGTAGMYVKSRRA